MGVFHMAGIFRNDPAIYPDIRAFLGCGLETQIRIGFHQIDGFTGKDNTQSRFAGTQLIADIVHAIGLHQWFLLNQHISCRHEFVLIYGIHGIAQNPQGNHNGIPGRILHKDTVLVLFIPKDFPAVYRLMYHFRIVHDAHRSPAVGNGIFAFPVKDA